MPTTTQHTDLDTRYCCGFAFNPGGSRVLLILKRRPRWQAGRWNGVGGKVEPNESTREAMSREFEEEVGIKTDPDNWLHCFNFSGPGFRVSFYRSFLSEEVFRSAKSETDERVSAHFVQEIHSICTIPNLRWMIPLMLDGDVRFPLSFEQTKHPGDNYT